MNDAEAKLRLEERRQAARIIFRAFAAFFGWCLLVIAFALLMGAT